MRVKIHRGANEIGNYKITPYPVCHSAFDAYALIMDIAVAKSKNDGSDIELLHFLRDILLGENNSENSEYKKEYNFNSLR